jgi:hypothetical protein
MLVIFYMENKPISTFLPKIFIAFSHWGNVKITLSNYVTSYSILPFFWKLIVVKLVKKPEVYDISIFVAT